MPIYLSLCMKEFDEVLKKLLSSTNLRSLAYSPKANFAQS